MSIINALFGDKFCEGCQRPITNSLVCDTSSDDLLLTLTNFLFGYFW